MPKRTNAFQELVTVLTQIAGSDAVTASELLPDRAIAGETREVDICVRSAVAGHEVLIGVECRTSSKRKQTVEWVEAMHGKHSHLPTHKLVLVSSSGFTKTAIKLAEFLNIKAIAPTQVDPAFVGDIVNNISTIWAKRHDITPTETLIVFDPPLGVVNNIMITGPFESLAVITSGGTSVCAAKDLAARCLRLDQTRDAVFRDALPGEAVLNLDQTPSLEDGSSLYLVLDETDPPQTRRRITNVKITAHVKTYVEEMPLQHGQYDGTPYSTGTAVMGDLNFHWVVTEGAGGKQMGARVTRVDDPTTGQFYRGNMG